MVETKFSFSIRGFILSASVLAFSAGGFGTHAAEGLPPAPAAASASIKNGDLVRAPIPLRAVASEVAAVSEGSLIVYQMPAIRGGQTAATAMLFQPKGSPPSGGWPLVVFGHDTTGWARECAPSVYTQASGHWEHAPWVADMLKSGMAVIAVDFEGMGDGALGVPDTGHPYYNLLSTGRSMAYAAVAAKRALGGKLSGVWGATGLSEGGFSALAAAQYSPLAREADAGLDYRGAISIAPVPYIADMHHIIEQRIKQASETHDLGKGYGELYFYNTETVYLVRSWLGAGYKVNPEEIYGVRMLKIYNEKPRLCMGALWGTVAADVSAYENENKLVNLPYDYPGIRHDVVTSSIIQAIFKENEAGQVKLPGKTLLVQGTADVNSFTSMVIKLNNTMVAKGSDVSMALFEGADHFGIIMPALPTMRAFWRQLFAAPVKNASN